MTGVGGGGATRRAPQLTGSAALVWADQGNWLLSPESLPAVSFYQLCPLPLLGAWGSPPSSPSPSPGPSRHTASRPDHSPGGRQPCLAAPSAPSLEVSDFLFACGRKPLSTGGEVAGSQTEREWGSGTHFPRKHTPCPVRGRGVRKGTGT